MKSLKLALVAMFIATALVSAANTDGFKSKEQKFVNIIFTDAIRNPVLVRTMYLQLNPGFLSTHEQLYVVDVTYNDVTYRILGSRYSWVKFFRQKWMFPGGDDSFVKNLD
jgi:hypothetical protein